MNISPLSFLRALSDETRLRILNLLHKKGELCVCELTHALQLSQPKISRHLAILREHQLLRDRREGQWIYYRLNPDIPGWSLRTLDALIQGAEDKSPFREDEARIQDQSLMGCGSVQS
jgi:ArsR family transcriptional regulator, arsenate/arsenite/antimonite-responsive transcriptional repressor